MKKTENLAITIQSYEDSHFEFIENTKNIDKFPHLKQDLDTFISMLPGKKVLDVGFGSGRDVLYFLNKNLNVEGVDLCKNFILKLQETINKLQPKQNVKLYHSDIRDFKTTKQYDGIWCSAVLLHFSHDEVRTILQNLRSILKENGILYLSFKQGAKQEWQRSGNIKLPRYFYYYEAKDILQIFKKEYLKCENILSQDGWISMHAKRS